MCSHVYQVRLHCSALHAQGSSLLVNSAFRDLWIPISVLGFLMASIVGGIVKISQDYDFPTPLAISILWAGYQAIPPFLVLTLTAEIQGPCVEQHLHMSPFDVWTIACLKVSLP